MQTLPCRKRVCPGYCRMIHFQLSILINSFSPVRLLYLPFDVSMFNPPYHSYHPPLPVLSCFSTLSLSVATVVERILFMYSNRSLGICPFNGPIFIFLPFFLFIPPFHFLPSIAPLSLHSSRLHDIFLNIPPFCFFQWAYLPLSFKNLLFSFL